MNVIIMTTGISGSSVVTGLLSKSGLWTGDETIFKDNITGKYETHENKKLVELNDALIKELGLSFDGKARYDPSARAEFAELYNRIDSSKYREFVKECNQNSPWIWKDPRLFLTIGYWTNILDLERTKIVVIYRNAYELWKSQTIKRIIYSYKYLEKSEKKARGELLNYLASNSYSYWSLEYDELISKPADAIAMLNNFIGLNISLEDWEEVYQAPGTFLAYKRTLLAYLIYFKNFGSRIRRGEN